MKAILIDPVRREIKGVEINPVTTGIAEAFGAGKVLVVTKMLGWNLVLLHDGHAKPPYFWFEGIPSAIPGKALLFGREKGRWPVGVTLNVKDVECLVRFASST